MTPVQEALPAVPEHVPGELVMDISLGEYNNQLEDPFLSGARLCKGPPLLWSQNAVQERAGWIPTRHDLIQEIFRDTEHFSSDRQIMALMGADWKLCPLEYDPPEHQVYRTVLNPLFTPRAMAAQDESIRSICHSLIDQFADSGRCEFTRDFAEQFPSYIFLDLMGMPHDMLQDFLSWERQMIHGTDPMERYSGFQSVIGYMDKFSCEQKANPQTPLWERIYSARIYDGRPLTHGEVMGMCLLLYIGGLDTVYSTLGWIFRHLAGDVSLQQELREHPEKIPAAVEEFLRAFPVATPERIVTEDMVFHGVQLRAGDAMFLPTYLAGRDPTVYENPHRIDIDRKARHITLATGPHMCLGMHLARRELKTVMEVFLARMSNIRIPAGESYQYKVGGVMTITHLPLEWNSA